MRIATSHLLGSSYVASARAGRAGTAQALRQLTANLFPKAGEALFDSLDGSATRVATSLVVVSREDAVSLIDSAQEGLGEAHGLLAELEALAAKACDPTLSDKDREALDQRFGEILTRLDQLSDRNPLLDGSFGGVVGAEGVAAMGITGITATDGLSGEAKLTIGQKDGKTTITLRIGEQTLTNTIGRKDKETVFELAGGQKVTIGFAGGAQSLIAGVVTRVDIRRGEVDLGGAMSADHHKKDVFVELGGQMVRFPALPDVSATGLGLHGKSLRTLQGSREALTAVHGALNRVESAQGKLEELMERIRKTPVSAARSMEEIYRDLGLDATANAVQALNAQSVRLSAAARKLLDA